MMKLNRIYCTPRAIKYFKKHKEIIEKTLPVTNDKKAPETTLEQKEKPNNIKKHQINNKISQIKK